jgi:hypothetical protein
VHNIAIDPMDENYFLSAGTTGDPTVTVWDQRFVKQRSTSNDAANAGAVLEFKPIVDNSHSASIWSLRYSGTKRGVFGVLANTGEFKVIELAQHTHRLSQNTKTPSSPAWSSPHYTKASHNLRYPSHDKEHHQSEKERVVAYDFMTVGSPLSGQCALALLPNREVEVFKVPPPAPRINVSALEEIYKDRNCIARPTPHHGTVAEDLIDIQNMSLSSKYGFDQDLGTSLSMSMSRASLSNSQRSLSTIPATQLSHETHDDLLHLDYPEVKIPLNDYLAVLQTAKRRTQEGYSLNCNKNKSVVSNDPWLVDAWTLVDRMDAHASNDGMVGNGLDLKYLGVSAIWTNELTMYDDRLIDPDTKTSQEMFSEAVKEIVEVMELPAFDGVKTQFPENRQLCLSLCGWSLDAAGVQKSCEELIGQGKTYKAIVLAVFQGHKDIALSLLRTLLQEKKLPQDDIGLAAIIACASPTSGVSADQRSACAWMADMTSDPYLKSLLTYFITSSWTTVVDMPSLSLSDRVAIALKYLPDPALTSFLTSTTTSSIRTGSIPGLLLTGLTSRALDLFTVYMTHHPSGLQDAVLLLSRACPLYIPDARWTLWKDTYMCHLQTWRAFLARTRYTREHNTLSVTREGTSGNKPSMPSLTLRCLNCQHNLALRKDPRTAKRHLLPTVRTASAMLPAMPATARPMAPSQQQQQQQQGHNKKVAHSPSLACPNCHTPMPRCGICMLWLGSPDPSKPGAARSLGAEDLEARLMVFCMGCSHGFHGHHARDWFARHAMCPVPDCGCMCGLLK